MSQLTFLQLSPASVTPTAQDLAEARKKKQGRIAMLGVCLSWVASMFADFGFFAGVEFLKVWVWLLCFALANTVGYWLSPRAPEKFLTWFNRQMMPYALFYALCLRAGPWLRAWLPHWAWLLYLVGLIGLAVVICKRYGHLFEEPAQPGPAPWPSVRP